jgi:hypothetical protein
MENTMKLTIYLSAAALAAGLLLGSTGHAAAQSDRTLGINCKVAGHERCDRVYYGARYRWRHWHRRHYWQR